MNRGCAILLISISLPLRAELPSNLDPADHYISQYYRSKNGHMLALIASRSKRLMQTTDGRRLIERVFWGDSSQSKDLYELFATESSRTVRNGKIVFQTFEVFSGVGNSTGEKIKIRLDNGFVVDMEAKTFDPETPFERHMLRNLEKTDPPNALLRQIPGVHEALWNEILANDVKIHPLEDSREIRRFYRYWDKNGREQFVVLEASAFDRHNLNPDIRLWYGPAGKLERLSYERSTRGLGPKGRPMSRDPLPATGWVYRTDKGELFIPTIEEPNRAYVTYTPTWKPAGSREVVSLDRLDALDIPQLARIGYDVHSIGVKFQPSPMDLFTKRSAINSFIAAAQIAGKGKPGKRDEPSEPRAVKVVLAAPYATAREHKGLVHQAYQDKAGNLFVVLDPNHKELASMGLPRGVLSNSYFLGNRDGGEIHQLWFRGSSIQSRGEKFTGTANFATSINEHSDLIVVEMDNHMVVINNHPLTLDQLSDRERRALNAQLVEKVIKVIPLPDTVRHPLHLLRSGDSGVFIYVDENNFARGAADYQVLIGPKEAMKETKVEQAIQSEDGGTTFIRMDAGALYIPVKKGAPITPFPIDFSYSGKNPLWVPRGKSPEDPVRLYRLNIGPQIFDKLGIPKARISGIIPHPCDLLFRKVGGSDTAP